MRSGEAMRRGLVMAAPVGELGSGGGKDRSTGAGDAERDGDGEPEGVKGSFGKHAESSVKRLFDVAGEESEVEGVAGLEADREEDGEDVEGEARPRGSRWSGCGGHGACVLAGRSGRASAAAELGMSSSESEATE